MYTLTWVALGGLIGGVLSLPATARALNGLFLTTSAIAPLIKTLSCVFRCV
jgi:hypothetical protein